MKLVVSHRWDVTIKEARQLQMQLRERVSLTNGPSADDVRIVAAADISYNRKHPLLYAALVLVKLPEFQPIRILTNKARANFPYVPGYLSFREVPALLPLFQQLDVDFDVLLCDGQGLAHPRRFGLACHLGVLLDKPSIGCAKSRLIGEFNPVGMHKGDHTPLWDGQEQVGIVLRTRDGVKPLFISPGHRISYENARAIVLRCVRQYRIPEPLRLAHMWVNKIRENDKVRDMS